MTCLCDVETDKVRPEITIGAYSGEFSVAQLRGIPV